MATILPVGTTLPTIFESTPVRVEFTAQLDSTDTLVSINIIEHRPNVGIAVQGAVFSGEYRDSFNLGKGSLKARLRSNGEVNVYDSWESLPPPQDADLFEFTAPSTLLTDYTYTVKLVYLYTPATEPGLPPPTPVEKEVTQTYTQTVKGNWNVWAKQLRDYVKASGPLPKERYASNSSSHG